MKSEFFDATVSRYSRRIFTYASYLLGNAGDAEDIAQEVLIKLWNRGGKIDEDRIGAWLLTVTRNACTDVLRRRHRSAEVISIRHETGLPTDHPSSEPNPERMAAGSQLGRRILRALNGLSEPSRSVVILREIQGLSYQEISEVTDVPINTVRVTLHRARRRLRVALREVRAHVATG